MNLPAVDHNSSSRVSWTVVDFGNMFKGILTPWLLRLHSDTYLTVSLLGLASLPWEDNQFALVLLQPLNISLKGFSWSVFPPMINCNTDCGSNFARDTSSLKWKHSVVQTFDTSVISILKINLKTKKEQIRITKRGKPEANTSGKRILINVEITWHY